MNSHRTIKLAIAALAAVGLLFSGCAKKEPEPVEPVKPVEQEQPVEPVEKVEPVQPKVSKPSTNSVYFAFDSAELDASAQAVLDAHVEWLNDNPDIQIRIEGNCDERGSREYNLALGQRRADSVKDYLVAHGVSSDRIDTISYGEERPVCTESGEACWAQNRRADIVVR